MTRAGFEWAKNAKCRGLEGPLLRDFFGEGEGANEREERAKRFCLGSEGGPACPVLAECLAQGMLELYGVWGGTTALDRERIRNRGGRVA